MKRLFSISLASTTFVLIASTYCGEPVLAGDIQSMFKDIVEKTVLKKGSNPAQAMTVNNINAQQAQLTQQISEGVSSGKITGVEERELRGKLAKVEAQKAAFLADGKYADPEVISLLADMNALSEKIKSYVGNTDTGAATSTSAVAAPVPTSEPVSTTNQASAGKTNTLYQRIADGVATGKINRSEANTLFDMESRIHGLETQLRSTTTGDFERQRLMFRELEQLTGSIDQNLAGR